MKYHASSTRRMDVPDRYSEQTNVFLYPFVCLSVVSEMQFDAYRVSSYHNIAFKMCWILSNLSAKKEALECCKSVLNIICVT